MYKKPIQSLPPPPPKGGEGGLADDGQNTDVYIQLLYMLMLSCNAVFSLLISTKRKQVYPFVSIYPCPC